MREPKISCNTIQAIKLFIYLHFHRFLDPLIQGDYPSVMRELVGNRLPHFMDKQKIKLKHSIDFIGINHYTTTYASAINRTWNIDHTDYYQDSLTSLTCNIFILIIVLFYSYFSF